MDFHSLMKKKLGGKYDQPKLAADDMAKEDDNNWWSLYGVWQRKTFLRILEEWNQV